MYKWVCPRFYGGALLQISVSSEASNLSIALSIALSLAHTTKHTETYEIFPRKIQLKNMSYFKQSAKVTPLIRGKPDESRERPRSEGQPKSRSIRENESREQLTTRSSNTVSQPKSKSLRENNYQEQAGTRPSNTESDVQSKSIRKGVGKYENFLTNPPLAMTVVRLHTLFKRYGGERHPKLEPYEVLKQRGDLLQWRYVFLFEPSHTSTNDILNTDTTHTFLNRIL